MGCGCPPCLCSEILGLGCEAKLYREAENEESTYGTPCDTWTAVQKLLSGLKVSANRKREMTNARDEVIAATLRAPRIKVQKDQMFCTGLFGWKNQFVFADNEDKRATELHRRS
jgi:hypothetical protein